MKILSVVGARPNFMKIASIDRAIRAQNEQGVPVEHFIVHTGQHYDDRMSVCFFDELDIPRPNVNLEVGSGSHAGQTAEIMQRFEAVLLEERPDVLMVVGDVNSTIAATLVASKIEYPEGSARKRPLIVHVEAGLRSFDRDMPEEVNRVLTDNLSDILFTTEAVAEENLRREGVSPDKVRFVGNTMIDTLIHNREKAVAPDSLAGLLEAAAEGGQAGDELVSALNSRSVRYGVVTLHRPSNVDTPAALKPLVDCLMEISLKLPLVFPLHPRTKNRLEQFGMYADLVNNKNVILTRPAGYLEFLSLLISSSLVLTDSGGIQEETTYLGVPCITLRENTERPVTVEMGTNYLVGIKPDKILSTAMSVLEGRGKRGAVPPLWDGKAGKRILDILLESV